MADDAHDYIEYQLDVENGVIAGCRPFGEGKQSEPLTGVKVYKPAGENIPDWWLERLERRLNLTLKRD